MNNNIEIKSLDLDFTFLGHRDYVHGSSMMEGMIKSISNYLPSGISMPANIKMFKVIREFDTQARAESMKTEDAQYHRFLKDAVARLDFVTAGRAMTSLLFARHGKTVVERQDSYDAGDYIDGVGVLDDDSSYGELINIKNVIDLARGVVEANRQITLKKPSLQCRIKKMRWAYLTNFKFFENYEEPRRTTVRFIPKTVYSIEDRIFAVKRIILEDYDSSEESDICFYIQPEEV
jgi:hypothetical protein